jgi:hypothetical protein
VARGKWKRRIARPFSSTDRIVLQAAIAGPIACAAVAWTFGALAGLSLFATLFVAVLVYRGSASSREIAALLPDPSPAEAFVVSVTLFTDGRRMGKDQGALSFLDGWVLFEGLTTSFALRSIDVRAVRPDGADLEATLKGDRQMMLLTPHTEACRTRFLAWFRSGEPAEGEPTLPPLGSAPL